MRDSTKRDAAPVRGLTLPAGRLLVLVVVAAGLLFTGPALADRDFAPEMLMQPFLGPEYSDWLVGPVARMASQDEVDEYLLLSSDEEAARFIAAFWESRGTRIHGEFGERKTVEVIFEERAAEADQQFSEGGIRGRRTDRGTIYVLHGPPEEEDYEVSPYEGGPPIIVWKYPRKAEDGLDGEGPDRVYRFFRDGGTTTFYTSIDRRRQLLEQQRRPPRF